MTNQKIENLKCKLSELEAKCRKIAEERTSHPRTVAFDAFRTMALNVKTEIEEEERLERETRFAVGDGVRWAAGTDCDPGTVVRVTEKSVYVVEDEATLLNASGSGEPDAMKFSPGGFVGHTSGTQRYEFSPGKGKTIRFSRRTRRNGNVVFKMEKTGSASTGSMRGWGVLYKGRAKHYDYNF